jgi:hypothetical protein
MQRERQRVATLGIVAMAANRKQRHYTTWKLPTFCYPICYRDGLRRHLPLPTSRCRSVPLPARSRAGDRDGQRRIPVNVATGIPLGAVSCHLDLGLEDGAGHRTVLPHDRRDRPNCASVMSGRRRCLRTVGTRRMTADRRGYRRARRRAHAVEKPARRRGTRRLPGPGRAPAAPASRSAVFLTVSLRGKVGLHSVVHIARFMSTTQ